MGRVIQTLNRLKRASRRVSSQTGRLYLAVGAVVVALSVAGCGILSPSASGTRLRLINAGSSSVRDLVILFPKDRIDFGDLPSGATSAYQSIPNGVFRYAAFRGGVDGVAINQPVIDWVGEEPLEGDAFTYTIDVVRSPTGNLAIRLIGVSRDS